MERARTHAFTSLAILLVCCARALALDASLDANQYAHTAWKLRDGFTMGATTAIVQTPDGYLWLGTEFGLVRFDGVRAFPWQPSASQQLPPGTIRSLLVTRDGTLWIGSASGLASLQNNKLSRYPDLDGDAVLALLEDRDGTVWAGAGGPPKAGKLCAVRKDAVHCVGGDGRFGPAVAGLYEDSRENLWVGVPEGLWKWKPGPPKFYALPGEWDGPALAEDSDDALLIGWKGAIYRFRDGKKEPYLLPDVSRQLRDGSILRDRDGGLWIGIRHHGILHVHQGRTDLFSALDGLSGDDVYALFEDREGNIWVSTLEGLDRFREFAVARLTVKQGLSRDAAGSILADKDGSIWLGTYGGLNRWDHGGITIPATGGDKQHGSLNGNKPGSFFQDDRGRIWVSTPQELGYLENNRFISIRGVPAGNVLSIVQDSAANVWAINEPTGLIRISPQNDVTKIPWADLGHKHHAMVLAADRKQGGLWVGFFAGGISYFSDGQIRASYTATDGLGAGSVADFHFDHNGTLWISTSGGLSRLKDNRVATLNSKNGLPCDTVHWAIEDDDNAFWLYTACGLVRIARSELDAWVAAIDKGVSAVHTVQVTVFDSSDGVRSPSEPGHYHPQVAKTADGKIWFLPWDGVSVIDPHNLHENRLPPPVHIEKITADDNAVDISDGMHLPTGVRHLDIDYTALSLGIPEKVRFRVKLEGEDKDWRELVNVRHVEYTNLPPKHYKFRVLACNNSGVWNEEGAALDFVIPPAWYQTNWFRGACIAAFLMMIWGIHELRVRQLAAQFNLTLEARVAERTRIARDLHDTLLQSFQGLLLQFKAVSYQLQPGKTKNALDAAIGDASQAITEGRDTVQGLRASTIEKNDLAVAIRAVGEELASTHSSQPAPKFQVFVEGTPRSLHPILRDEVYRTAAEALRNAFQHAHAQEIEVELRYDQRDFKVRVRDDGKGIAREILSSGGRKGHFGLHGMSEHAKLAGGELAIWSEVDSGTEIELTIPASRAYTRSARRFWWSRKPSQKDPDVKEKVES